MFRAVSTHVNDKHEFDGTEKFYLFICRFQACIIVLLDVLIK